MPKPINGWVPMVAPEGGAILRIDGVLVAQITPLLGRYYCEIVGLKPMKAGWADTRTAAMRAVRKAIRETDRDA